MSDLKICRICLRTETKVYHYNQFQLKCYYEEVMALKVNDADGLPHYFCYECAMMLHKFHKFKEKCYRGQKAFKELLWSGPITYESVYKIDRESKHLQSELGYVSNTAKLKAFITVDCTDSEKITTDIDSIVNTDTQNSNEFCSEPDSIRNSSNNEHSNSPKTVYINDDVIQLKTEVINTRRKKRSGEGLKKNSLDARYWNIYTLTEEDALKEFRKKAEDVKYVLAGYKCKDCFKGFSKGDMLKRHIQLRHSESKGSFECRFCRMRFKWDCHLRRHMLRHYTKYECLRCRLVCPVEETALLHDEYHSGKPKKCMHCGKEFRHTSTYYTHLRTHRSGHVCTLCGESFVSDTGLNQHRRLKHVVYEIESPDDDEEVNTFCERCGIRFETRKAYEEHLFHSDMHTDVLDHNEENQESAPMKVLGKKIQAKVTTTLKRRAADEDPLAKLKIKRRRKTKRQHRKPSTCYQCGQHFNTQMACVKHHQAAHPRTSLFPPSQRHICEICGASLAPGSVAAHQNTHTRTNVYPCGFCGKQFYSRVSLKRHSVTHTGEKPFACPLCDKRFTQSNSMKLHHRTFHLKQPYPKRIRKKKTAEEQKKTDRTTDEESDYSLLEPDSENATSETIQDQDPRSQTRPVSEITTGALQPIQDATDRHIPEENNVHYLTLA